MWSGWFATGIEIMSKIEWFAVGMVVGSWLTYAVALLFNILGA